MLMGISSVSSPHMGTWEVPPARSSQKEPSIENAHCVGASPLPACAGWAVERIRGAMAEHGLTDAFLATDLRSGASGTYAVGPAQAEALRVLHASVPSLDNSRLRAFIDAIPDAGVRANVETAICLKAVAVLATSSACRDCERARRCAKTSSGFGAYVVNRRRAYGRPTAPLF